MSSIFNLQRAFDPRHLSIDKEESEPIVVRGVHSSPPPHAPVSGTHEARPDTGPREISSAIYGQPPVQPIPQLKNFFCTSTLNLIDFHTNEAPPALLPPLIPQSNSSGPRAWMTERQETRASETDGQLSGRM